MQIFKRKNTLTPNPILNEVTITDSFTAKLMRKGEVMEFRTTEVNPLSLSEKRKLKVTVSSSQDDDEVLLHNLLTKIRK